MTYSSAALATETTSSVLTLLEPVDAQKRFSAIEALAGEVAAGRRPPSIVFWRAARALSVTGAEARLPGFEMARQRLERDGWPVFVPFPHATHDHQARNAQSLSDLGAARLLPQTELDGPVLAALALGLLDNPQELRRMGAAARGFAKPDAARAIIEAMEKLVTAKHKARHA